jgi:hypothetical protein
MLFNYGEYATFKRRNMSTNKEIIVLNETVRVQQTLQDDYISLTDIAKYKNPDDPRFIRYVFVMERGSFDQHKVVLGIDTKYVLSGSSSTARIKSGLTT